MLVASRLIQRYVYAREHMLNKNINFNILPSKIGFGFLIISTLFVDINAESKLNYSLSISEISRFEVFYKTRNDTGNIFWDPVVLSTGFYKRNLNDDSKLYYTTNLLFTLPLYLMYEIGDPKRDLADWEYLYVLPISLWGLFVTGLNPNFAIPIVRNKSEVNFGIKWDNFISYGDPPNISGYIDILQKFGFFEIKPYVYYPFKKSYFKEKTIKIGIAIGLSRKKGK